MASANGTLPPDVIERYKTGKMSPAGMAKLEGDVANGLWDPFEGLKVGAAPTPAPSSAPSGTQVDVSSTPASSSAAPSEAPTPTPGASVPTREEFEADQPREDKIDSWLWQPDVWKTLWATSTTDTPETIKILKSFDPTLKHETLDNGTVIFTRKDGTEFKIAPGMRVDNAITTAIGALGQAGASMLTSKFLASSMLASVPVLGALAARMAPIVKKIPGAAKVVLGGMLEQAGVEATHALAGGSADPRAVAVAGGLGAGLVGAQAAAKGAGSLVRRAADAISPPGGAIPQLDDAAQMGGAFMLGAPKPDNLVFKGGDPEAAIALANAFQPNQAVVQAARARGVAPENLPLGMVSGNEAMQQTIKTLTDEKLGSAFGASEKAKGLALAKDIDAGLREMSGSPPGAPPVPTLAQTSNAIELANEAKITRLEGMESAAYKRLTKEIGPSTPVDTSAALAFITAKENELVEKWAKGTGAPYNESPLMKRVKEMLTPVEVVEISKKTGNPIIDKITKKPRTRLSRPTWARVQQVLKDVKAASHAEGIYAEDPNRWIAAELAARLDEAQIATARNVDPALPARLELAQGYVRDKYATMAQQKAIFGKELERSLVGEAREGMSGGLVNRDPKKLQVLLDKVAPERRKDVVRSALADVFLTHGADDFSSFNRLWEAVNREPQSQTLLLSHLAPGSRKMFDDLYTLTKAFEKYKGVTALSHEAMKPDPSMARAFLNGVIDVSRIGTLAMPWRTAGMSRMFLSMLKDPGSPKLKVVQNWLTDPTTRSFLMGFTQHGPPPPGVIRTMVDSPAFKHLGRVVDMGPDKLQWVNRLIRSSVYPRGRVEE